MSTAKSYEEMSRKELIEKIKELEKRPRRLGRCAKCISFVYSDDCEAHGNGIYLCGSCALEDHRD